MKLLNSPTFQDHAGQPSFGRKATFWVLIFAGVIALVALGLVAWLDPSKIQTVALGIIGWCATIVSIVYVAAQGSKGAAQLNNPTTPPAPGVPSTTVPPSLPSTPPTSQPPTTSSLPMPNATAPNPDKPPTN